jgi:hypothetical protein
MALSQEQKLHKNSKRVEQKKAAKEARLSTPREGAREDLVSKLVVSVIKKVVQKAKARARTRKWKSDDPERARQRDKDNYESAKKAAQDAGISYAEFLELRKEENSTKDAYDANRRIKERKASDPEFLVVSRLRTRLGEFMKLSNGTKAAGTMDLVGCTKKKLLDHLTSQLPAGESLQENSIDHIFPMSRYKMDDPDEQRRCMNYTNLQPLRMYGIGGNSSKSNSLPPLELALRVSRDCWPASISESDLN